MKRFSSLAGASGLTLLMLLASACGRTSRPGTTTATPPATAGSSAQGGAMGEGGAGSCCGSPDCSCDDTPPSPHGLVPMHRLRGVEYSNSIMDVLGVQATAPAADEARPFDAVIDDAGPWFKAAASVARDFIERGDLPEPLSCINAAADRACASAVIDELGPRAFRRPLLDAEREAFMAVYDASAPLDPKTALQDVVRALLLSPSFLFHVELSDDPDGTASEPLDSYALAARLSFALWSTTPDAELLKAAAADLTGDAALEASFQRLSQHPRAQSLPDGWGEVWLGRSQLENHEVDIHAFVLNAELRAAMMNEQVAVLRHFWQEPQPLVGLMSLDLSFVDDTLAVHYGFPAGTSGLVSITNDARVGLLGQAGILTLTSLPGRVSASKRGRFVVERLLCHPPPAPPPSESGSLGSRFPTGKSERAALEQALVSPSCAACHRLFDPFGLALAEFDGIGAYRTTDSQGQPVDAAVTLPEQVVPGGIKVTGEAGLAAALAESQPFHRCVAQQLASYLIQRNITDQTDADLVFPLGQDVADQASLAELTRSVVMSDHFRYRRLAPTP